MTHIRNAVFAAVVFAFLFAGCTQKSTPAEMEVDGGDSGEPGPVESFQFISDKQIAVVFGHGYNDEPFVPETLSKIEQVFGLASEGSLVLPLIYPADFANGRIALLYDKLAEYDICGLIVIGAPENTHRVLARLQDSWGTAAPAYPVIMLSPQDKEPLGIEAGADLVLDFVAKSDEFAVDEQTSQMPVEMSEILFALIRHIYSLKETFDPATSNVAESGKELLGDAWEIAPYTDPETGLYAINHFVIGKGKDRE
jgi:hypothetical protein